MPVQIELVLGQAAVLRPHALGVTDVRQTVLDGDALPQFGATLRRALTLSQILLEFCNRPAFGASPCCAIGIG
jgi:hypothetical protein